MVANDRTPKKPNRNLIFIVAIVIVAALVVGVVALNATGIINLSTSPTSSTPTAIGNEIQQASSLEYTVTGGDMGSSQINTLYAKNIGSPDMMIRMDTVSHDLSGNFTSLINGVQNKAWWTPSLEVGLVPVSDFNMMITRFNSTFVRFQNRLTYWSGNGDYTYADSTGTITISNVVINPALPDSFFEPNNQ